MNLFFDDNLRFIKILELLPENFVDNFVNYYLYNAYYPEEYSDIFFEYTRRKKEILFEFSNVRVQSAYQKFNESFDTLQGFVVLHFHIPIEYHRTHKTSQIFYLEPRFHHNFRISEGGKMEDLSKDSKKWDDYKSETDKHAENFERAYRFFLRVAKKEIGQNTKEEIFKLSPEFHGIKINFKLLCEKLKNYVIKRKNNK